MDFRRPQSAYYVAEACILDGKIPLSISCRPEVCASLIELAHVERCPSG